jgi:hypothetical protein
MLPSAFDGKMTLSGQFSEMLRRLEAISDSH